MLDHLFDTSRGDTALQVPGPIAGGISQVVGIANLNGVGDPGVGQDNTQGYTIGSVYFNANAGQLRWWVCRDATTGAAKWVFDGADYANGGTNPSNEITQFGGASGAQMAEEGNINRQVSVAGVQPGSTGSDIVLAVYTLPAAAFDQAGRGLNIIACGSMVVNTNVKTVKLIAGATSAVVGSAVVGGTVIGSLITTGSVGGGWQVSANIFKGASANQQLALHEASQVGSFIGALLAPSTLALTESGAVIIAVTGNAATAATDITYNFLDVNAMN